MGTLLFATTKLRGLHAAGRTSDLQRDLLSAMLERHLGPAYAHLFAEFETRDSDTRDWFVDAAPAPINIRDLPQEHAAALKARCDTQLAAIHALADRLDGDGANSRNLARAMRDATVFPPEDLWFYRGAPLIVNWGFSRADGHKAAVSAIAGATVILDPDPVPAAAAPTLEPPRKKRWLGWLPFFLWLAFVALVARIYGDLLPACGLQLPAPFTAGVSNCPIAVVADDAVTEGARLQRQVEQAELDLARGQQGCAQSRRGAVLEHGHSPDLFAGASRFAFTRAQDRAARN